MPDRLVPFTSIKFTPALILTWNVDVRIKVTEYWKWPYQASKFFT